MAGEKSQACSVGSRHRPAEQIMAARGAGHPPTKTPRSQGQGAALPSKARWLQGWESGVCSGGLHFPCLVPSVASLSSRNWADLRTCGFPCVLSLVAAALNFQYILLSCDSRQKAQMQKRSGDKTVDERQLFHGTNSTFVDAICQQNFDWRVCGLHGTSYGKGENAALAKRLSFRRWTEVGGTRTWGTSPLGSRFERGSAEARAPFSGPGVSRGPELLQEHLQSMHNCRGGISECLEIISNPGKLQE